MGGTPAASEGARRGWKPATRCMCSSKVWLFIGLEFGGCVLSLEAMNAPDEEMERSWNGLEA